MSDRADNTAQIQNLDLPVAPTVLIVDDDELVLARLRELVEAAGYHCTEQLALAVASAELAISNGGERLF